MATSLRLLGVFAHPDDESFGSGGMLARYSRTGVEVHVCTVTDGAAGSTDQAVLKETAATSLAVLRQQELGCACAALGVQLHRLGYRDSGMEGSPANKLADSLYQADLQAAAREIARVIRQVRPQVVVTHDPTGGYFHPDHIKVNHAVSRAFGRAGDSAAYEDLAAEGLEPWQPQRLYYGVIPRSQLTWTLRLLRLLGRDVRHLGRNGDIDLTGIGVPDREIQVRLDVGPYLTVKEQASACHRSQGGGGLPRLIPAPLRKRMQRYEYYVQAYPPAGRRHSDLFAGIAGA